MNRIFAATPEAGYNEEVAIFMRDLENCYMRRGRDQCANLDFRKFGQSPDAASLFFDAAERLSDQSELLTTWMRTYCNSGTDSRSQFC